MWLTFSLGSGSSSKAQRYADETGGRVLNKNQSEIESALTQIRNYMVNTFWVAFPVAEYEVFQKGKDGIEMTVSLQTSNKTVVSNAYTAVLALPATTPTPTPPPLAGKRIGLDPGHQQRANFNPEPIAPDETKTKMKCSTGTRGIATGIYEYEVNLDVALKLKALLEEAGAEVVMTRTTNNVSISKASKSNCC